MGKQAPAPRRAESEALSLHTTPDDYEYDDLPRPSDLPPSYADSEYAASSSAAVPQPVVPVVPDLVLTQHETEQDEYIPVSEATGWRSYLDPLPIDTKDTKVRIDRRLQDPYHLHAYIMDELRRLPPRPTIRIYGYHYEKRRKAGGHRRRTREKDRVTDFDIEVSLQGLLRHAFDQDFWSESVVDNWESAYRGSFRKTKPPGVRQGALLTDEPAPDLKEWCERYCESPARLKVFRVRRKVIGFDETLLENMISEMVRSTDYDGCCEITFPTYDRKVDIYSPHWANRVRTSWVRNVFYFTMLWILTWPILLLYTRWYCVYTVYWKASDVKRDPTDPTRSIKTHACMSERDWFSLHRGYLRHLVLQHFQGTADTSPSIITEWNRNARPGRGRV